MQKKIQDVQDVTLHSMIELNQCNPVIWLKRCFTYSFNREIKLPGNSE